MKWPLFILALAAVTAILSHSASAQYVITNDSQPFSGNSTSVFKVVGSGLSFVTTISTGGVGRSSTFASPGINITRTSNSACLYIADAGSSKTYPNGDIAAINQSLNVVGNFVGSSTDSGTDKGIGLATSKKGFLYAAYSTSQTIGTFKINSNCSLTFIGDTPAVGIRNGGPDGIRVDPTGNILVVTFNEGTIASYNVSSGLAVSNGDAQLSTCNLTIGTDPSGVDLTADSKFAIFGQFSNHTDVDVSPIVGGKLTTTACYPNVGTGGSSDNVWLSPDETLLYIANTLSGQVTAAKFNKNTGAVLPGSTSAALKNYLITWFSLGRVATLKTTGNGSAIFVAESGAGLTSSIGILKVNANGTLTEIPSSPVTVSGSPFLSSIAAYPLRPF